MLLVTGITGHSGKHFLEELVKNKYQGKIRCIIRPSTDTKILDRSGLHIEKLVGDLSDQPFVDRAAEGVSTIVHISSIFYSENIIKAAVKENVNRVILVHTTGIYSKYKSASEEYKKIELNIKKIINDNNSTVNLIFLRPTMIYGYINDRNMIIFIKMVDKLRIFPIINKGQNLLQPVNGKDLGKAYYQVLTKNEIVEGDYILSGEKPITMAEMFKILSLKLGKKTIFINVPLGLGILMARCLKVATFGKLDFIEKVQRMGEDRNYPHDMARKHFGYCPMSFEEGIQMEIVEYLKDKKKV